MQEPEGGCICESVDENDRPLRLLSSRLGVGAENWNPMVLLVVVSFFSTLVCRGLLCADAAEKLDSLI